MVKLIAGGSKEKVKRAVRESKTLDEAARVLGCTRPGLSMYLARNLAEWWANLRLERRDRNRVARRRRWRHRQEARQTAEAVAHDPSLWDRLSPRRQQLVRAWLAGPSDLPGAPLPPDRQRRGT